MASVSVSVRVCSSCGSSVPFFGECPVCAEAERFAKKIAKIREKRELEQRAVELLKRFAVPDPNNGYAKPGFGYTGYDDEIYECVYCEADTPTSEGANEIHKPDCPITQARQLLTELDALAKRDRARAEFDAFTRGVVAALTCGEQEEGRDG